MKLLILTSAIFIQFLSSSFAQTSADLSEMSLEELMNVKVSVATETEKPIREAAGVITVITAEQIKSLGARDLKDILRTVPGIHFGHDLMGNISIIMRGVWGHEGRVLLLIDGLEMNERSFGDIFVANHYPPELIKKIEIIRGPGSAIYGGFAELGVINIITKDGADLKGFHASSTYGRTNKEFSQSTTNYMFGHEKEGLNLSVKGSYNNSNFSDRSYTDENGAQGTFADGNSKMGGSFLNFRGKYKPLYINFIKDNHRTENIVQYGNLENTPGSGDIRKPVPHKYLMDVYQVGYQNDISEKVNLHLYYQNKVQFSYFQPDAINDVEYEDSYRRRVERKLYGLKTKFQLSESLNLNAGAEHSYDLGRALNRTNFAGDPDGYGGGSKGTLSIGNTALFSQFDLTSALANVTAGIRYDIPTDFDKTLVPRLGVTRVFGKAHVKALFAKAFRAPVLENLSLNEDIKPETSTTSELEVGYHFTKNLSWTMNLFSTKIEDIIVYSYNNNTNTELYSNYDYQKTIGLESEILYRHNIHDIKFNLSTYRVDSINAAPFESNKESDALLGSPKIKLFLSDTMMLSDNFELTPSLRYLKRTTAFKWDGTQASEQRLDDQLIADIFGNYKNFVLKGVELGAGINNILNTNVYYTQPYRKEGNSVATPYPGQSREYVVRLGYAHNF